MSYSGTTAASTVANPPVCIGGYLGLGPNSTASAAAGSWGKSLWLYNSSHSSTQLTDSNFFSDAQALGMKMNDIVMAVCNTGSSVSIVIGVLSSVTSDGANLASTGGILSSTR
jgi:hypothetical protein